MLDILQDTGLDGKKLIRLIKNLYRYQPARIRIESKTSNSININKTELRIVTQVI